MSNVLCQQKPECQDFIFANLIENGIAWSFFLFIFMLTWIWMRFNKNSVYVDAVSLNKYHIS